MKRLFNLSTWQQRIKSGMLPGLLFLTLPLYPGEYPIDLTKAMQYMREAKALSDQDNGRLWGISLYGPILMVDPDTRFVVANEPDPYGRLSREGELYVGYLSQDDMIANTALRWSGKHWMMVIFSSLSDDPEKRMNLMMHELWHTIQDSIGLPMANPDNSHLDQMDARILLKLEWEALEKAVGSTGERRRRCISDALAFRELRQTGYPGANKSECRLEMHEGLAEYTGMVLSHQSASGIRKYMEQLDNRKKVPGYVRSFAYVSGPLYGYLLDESGTTWREGLTPASDLGRLLAGAWEIEIPAIGKEDLAIAASPYSYDQIFSVEQQRDTIIQQKLRRLKAKFIDGKTLEVAFIQMKIEFDPTNLVAFEDIGTVYPTLKITDQWGRLVVEGDALLGKNWDFVRLNADTIETVGNTIKGDGWILELQDGWKLRDDNGNMILEKF